jgi:hypothetical protein
MWIRLLRDSWFYGQPCPLWLHLSPPRARIGLFVVHHHLWAPPFALWSRLRFYRIVGTSFWRWWKRMPSDHGPNQDASVSVRIANCILLFKLQICPPLFPDHLHTVLSFHSLCAYVFIMIPVYNHKMYFNRRTTPINSSFMRFTQMQMRWPFIKRNPTLRYVKILQRV